jgi:phytoene synthase
MSSSQALDAARIVDPALRAAYESARALHAEHGRTYYAATRLLPVQRRPFVHALYGFARYVDDIVDAPARDADHAAQRLDELQAAVLAAGSTAPTEPVVAAVRDTARRFDLPAEHLRSFLSSMRADITVDRYPTHADLDRYVWGSAAVIGLLVLPILGTTGERRLAEPYAADLGVAFQLTNFIRDVGEDFRRGRIYLPTETMAAFGVDDERLARGVVDGPIRRWLAHEIARTREIYRSAAPGIRLLDPASQPCVRTAFLLYGEILDEIERSGYRVLDRRVSVPTWRRARLAAAPVARLAAQRARSRWRPATPPPAAPDTPPGSIG